MMEPRTAKIHRQTNETDITCQLNLDGAGRYEIDTGVGFLDHMLTHVSKHSRIDLTVRAKGDLHIDAHHTVEDVGIVIGQAVAKALGGVGIGCAQPQAGGRRGVQPRLERRGLACGAGLGRHRGRCGRSPYSAGDVIQRVVGLVDHGAGAVPVRRGVARHVVGVEQVGLVAAGASHPLPAEVVAGEIAIEQVRHEPVGTRAPMHVPQVHHIACQPHAGVVVQVTGRVQRMAERVDAGQPGGALVASVPRYWPERLCWALSDAYHANEGGHIRIFRAARLNRDIEALGFRRYRRHWAHALHAPFWWLKCLLWERQHESRLVALYHRLLVWDLMEGPRPPRRPFRLSDR